MQILGKVDVMINDTHSYILGKVAVGRLSALYGNLETYICNIFLMVYGSFVCSHSTTWWKGQECQQGHQK